MSGHFYESEVLLKQRECDADDKSACKSDKGDHPSLQDEYPLYEAVLRSETAEGAYVVPFLDDEH